MGVFDTSVKTDATLPTWFTDAQKASATTGKTVYDAATPFSGTAGSTMSKDLFGTPSQTSMPNYYAPQGASATATPKTEDDWNKFSSMAQFAAGTDMEKAKADYMSGVGGGGVNVAGNATGGGATGGGALPTTNPFMTAMGTLQSVASGAANPWLENGDPNTKTALGGLFSAQNAKLNQILPEIAAQTGAGGIGGGNYYGANINGTNGGSGGGTNNDFSAQLPRGTPGSGIPGQGNTGFFSAVNSQVGGGGGGAGAVGGTVSINGGIGLQNSLRTGSAVYYAGGGGGGQGDNAYQGSAGGAGGLGGGGAGGLGGINPGFDGSPGTANTGGGGGGSGGTLGTPTAGGNGGSGIVVIRYKSGSQRIVGGTITTYTSGGDFYWIHTFLSSTTIRVA